MTPDDYVRLATDIEHEVGKVIVGQHDLVRGVLISMLAGGHTLLEGVPGLGKTLLVRTLGEVLNLSFSRVQFTPDLMPTDITGTNILVEDEAGGRVFRFQGGPIFANLLLADEINRATPKTQSALLEAMQERRVTVGKETHPLQLPFFVLATQNPIEMEGTYPLPEAQLDRFFFKLNVPYPTADELVVIAEKTTSRPPPKVSRVADGQALGEMIDFSRELPIARPVLNYAAEVVWRTHPTHDSSPDLVKRFVRYGASPRGVQALVLGAKIRALLEGRFNVAYEDIRAIAPGALRHRFVLNFEADAENVSADTVLQAVLAAAIHD